MNAVMKACFKRLPFFASALYLLVAVHVMYSEREWWGLILYTITLPAGIVFQYLSETLSGAILSENPADTELWVSNVNHAFRIFVFVAGGMIWFYLLGVAIQWLGYRLGRFAPK